MLLPLGSSQSDVSNHGIPTAVQVPPRRRLHVAVDLGRCLRTKFGNMRTFIVGLVMSTRIRSRAWRPVELWVLLPASTAVQFRKVIGIASIVSGSRRYLSIVTEIISLVVPALKRMPVGPTLRVIAGLSRDYLQ